MNTVLDSILSRLLSCRARSIIQVALHKIRMKTKLTRSASTFLESESFFVVLYIVSQHFNVNFYSFLFSFFVFFRGVTR